MVLEALGPNSPAAKAGLKPHDILLEVNGKPVPSKREEFDKLLASIEPNKKVEVVVLRKGKKETVKDLTLPVAKAVAAEPEMPRAIPGLRGRRLLLPNLGDLGGAGDLTSVTRNNDEFTVRNRSGDVTITVKGTVDEGKSKVSEVTIASDGKTKTYDSVAKVPAEHQEKVKKLAELAVRGNRFRFR